MRDEGACPAHAARRDLPHQPVRHREGRVVTLPELGHEEQRAYYEPDPGKARIHPDRIRDAELAAALALADAVVRGAGVFQGDAAVAEVV
ncbi:hypothetical protein GCM10017557_44030 [Streptomyces aurantiacus]|uniref:Uncharacterized protein n=1 Tax=Streptomyces aurantiacus TaxID=47760 RepID=A0A7G1P6Q3_9ACTN|nr:hypothetical protein GCM10017557_44030 [Streptomyces aurantiacus]